MAMALRACLKKIGCSMQAHSLSTTRKTLTRACVLFDLDGTLVDTDKIHFQAWQKLLERYNTSLTEEEYIHVAGRMNAPVLLEMFPDMSPAEAQQESLRKEELFRDIAQQDAPQVAGIEELLSYLEDREVPKTIVTNAPRANVNMLLKGSGLDKYFPEALQVLADEQCEHAKPHPEPYLAGLRQFDCAPQRAIAFEDSVAGATAAIAAGIPTVGILTTQSAETMYNTRCIVAAPDYTAPTVWNLVATLVGDKKRLV
eukprot:m.352168 g.352168  ORF g.352168 m.352168 type:complete len:256 (-) comp16460_c0_seq1:1031-1798(-)